MRIGLFLFENAPAPRLSTAADGQPSIPSGPASGAKSEGAAPLSLGGVGESQCRHFGKGLRAVTNFGDTHDDLSPAESRRFVTRAIIAAGVALVFIAVLFSALSSPPALITGAGARGSLPADAPVPALFEGDVS